MRTAGSDTPRAFKRASGKRFSFTARDGTRSTAIPLPTTHERGHLGWMDKLDRSRTDSMVRSFSALVGRLVADKESLLAGVRLALIVASYVGAFLAAEQGQVIAPRQFFFSIGLVMFGELIPALIVVDRRLEFIGWHAAVQRIVRAVCTYLFVPLRVGMWLSPFVAALCSPMLLILAVPLVLWGEWLVRELGRPPGRS